MLEKPICIVLSFWHFIHTLLNSVAKSTVNIFAMCKCRIQFSNIHNPSLNYESMTILETVQNNLKQTEEGRHIKFHLVYCKEKNYYMVT